MGLGRRFTAQGFLAMLLIASVCGAAERRPAVPMFGVDVEIVSLNVSVTDVKDRHVGDLGEGDLVVFEDGVRQEICLFSRERLPLSLVVLIDSSSSMLPTLPIAKAAARRLLRTLGAQDQARVAAFNRRLTVLQDFTSDLASLESAVGRIEANGETSLYNALYLTLKDLAALKGEGELVQRAIVVLSDGRDTASLVTDAQVLELARAAEVTVYSIGLFEQQTGLLADTGLEKFFLTDLARSTGGRAYFPGMLAELDGAYDRIAEELRTLYGVGYVSSNTRRDGQWRRIAIRTARENLLVRHRPGYYAPRASRSALAVSPTPLAVAEGRR